MKIHGKSLEADAWTENRVGIWYGAWTADDLKIAITKSDVEGARWLSDTPHHHETLGWPVELRYFQTARRFSDISDNDWVYVYFDNALHFARVDGHIQSDQYDALNRDKEVLKFLHLREETRKSFSLSRLSDLLDSFRLLPQAGRGNVHEVKGTNRRLVALLAASMNEEEVAAKVIRIMRSDTWLTDWLALIGPSAWESVCEGYLILKQNFVPTGLRVGGTLKTFDIVGRDFQTGAQILAQCKKDDKPMPIDSSFVEACTACEPPPNAYYFAYGGCVSGSDAITRVDGTKMEKWFKEEQDGKRYASLLRGDLLRHLGADGGVAQ
jgi:hypothetical protein